MSRAHSPLTTRVRASYQERVPRYFDLDEAQSLIPRLSTLMSDSLQLHMLLRGAVGELGETENDLTWALLRGDVELDDDSELEDIVALERARAVYSLLRHKLDEIEGLGAEVEVLTEGVVDFHSWLDGRREVRLSWRVGEPEIGWYHESNSEPESRKPVEGHRFTREPDDRQATG